MKSISLKLPDRLHAQLERLSQERSASKSDVVREAFESYFANGKCGRHLSIAELAADLVGSIEGPFDLATDPKYMRSFGK